MKLASIKLKSSGQLTVAAVVKGGYLDLHAASAGELPAKMIEFLEAGSAAMAQARAAADPTAAELDAERA